MRCCTAADVPRCRRGSLYDESDELGGRFILRAGAFFGATVSKALDSVEGATGLVLAVSFGLATLPLGLSRGRFTGTSCSGSGDGTDSASGLESSAVVEAISSPVVSVIGSRITSIYFNDLFNYAIGSGVNKSSKLKWLPWRGTMSPNESRMLISRLVSVRPPSGM